MKLNEQEVQQYKELIVKCLNLTPCEGFAAISAFHLQVTVRISLFPGEIPVRPKKKRAKRRNRVASI